MGDVILVTPVLSFLRGRHPGCAIELATRPEYAGLFAQDPRVAKVWEIPRSKTPGSLFRPSYDLVVDLQNNSSSRRIRRGLGRIGATGVFRKYHIKRLLLLAFRVDTYPRDDHVVTRYARAAGWDPSRDREPDSPKLFPVGPEKDSGRSRDPRVALMPFSAWKNKQWPIENYAEVGRYFLAGGNELVLLGGPGEAGAARELNRMLGGACRNEVGKLGVAECSRLLRTCRLAVGNDTGLSHMARACGVPTGIVFGSTTRHLGFFPYGTPAFRVFEARRWCRPCHAHGGTTCLRGSRRCLRDITPPAVIEGLKSLEKETRA